MTRLRARSCGERRGSEENAQGGERETSGVEEDGRVEGEERKIVVEAELSRREKEKASTGHKLEANHSRGEAEDEEEAEQSGVVVV